MRTPPEPIGVVKKSVLVVESCPETRSGLSDLLRTRFDLVAVASPEEALEALRQRGPFGVVVADQDLPGMGGLDLLRLVSATWPEAVGILVASDPSILEESTRESRVYRPVARTAGPEILVAAVDAAVRKHEDLESDEADSYEMAFSRDSLESFTTLLEERIARQAETLRRLNRFAVELNAAGSMKEIVQIAAEAASEALDGRGVHVQVWDGS